MAQPQTTTGVIKPGHGRMAREAPEHQSKVQANKAAVDAINQARATVENSIVSILTGGNPEQAIAAAEQAAASVNPATKTRLVAGTDNAPGMIAVPGELVGQAPTVELVFSTDKTGLVRVHKATCRHLPKQTAPLVEWPGRVFASYCCKPRVQPKVVTSKDSKASASKGKAAERIATLNAHKAAASAARDAGHPIPDGQLATMDAKQAGKVERARRTRQAPPAMASAS